MNGQRLLIRRTARILAVSRVILAIIFLTAMRLDPAHVARAGGMIFALLSVYLLWAGLVALIVWRSWWWDFRLARTFHVIDIAVFLAAELLAEAGNSYASSPFLGFTAFLLISVISRWGVNGMVLTAITLVCSYCIGGALLAMFGGSVGAYQFWRHFVSLIALSLIVIRFGAGVRVPLIDPMPEADGIPGQRHDLMMAEVLAFARQTFNAQGAALAIIAADAPQIGIYRDRGGSFQHEILDDCTRTDDLGADIDAVLFDSERQRRILSLSNRRLKSARDPFAYTLADVCQVSTGIIARLSSAKGQSLLLVWGMPVSTIDDLPVIRALAREVGLALDREEMAVLAQSIAVSGVRNALARDLHDSAAQFLAGTLFRLEALRRWIREGRDPETEILAMREALRLEQLQLRALIDRLRLGLIPDRSIDLAAELEALIGEMGQHWNIVTTLHAPQRPLPVSVDLAYELRLLVREAVANAVRHGQCSQVDLVIEYSQEGLLQVSIDDNGKGFKENHTTNHPRSISERIAALGGQLQVASGASGVRLDIALPLQIAA